jgi:hypothetical protein
MIKRLKRFLAGLLVVSLAAVSIPAQAGLLGTDAVLAGTERARIVSFLERDEVRAQLEARGVATADVKARVAAMTDEEAASLAARIDALPAGGDVLGVLLTVFIVLLITDILGFTKIFPFTRSVR